MGQRSGRRRGCPNQGDRISNLATIRRAKGKEVNIGRMKKNDRGIIAIDDSVSMPVEKLNKSERGRIKNQKN